MLLVCLLVGLTMGACDGLWDTPPEPAPEPEPIWVPPYSACAEYGFTCGELTDDVIERSERLDALVSAELATGTPLEEIAEIVNADDSQRATVTDDSTLTWWIEGGVPRIRIGRDDTVVTPTRSLVTDDDFTAFLGDLTSTGALRTRRRALSAHGQREGFDRNEKSVLILSPFYGQLGAWVEETDILERSFRDDPQYTTVRVLKGAEVGFQAFHDFKDYDVIHVISHGAHTVTVNTEDKRIAALATSTTASRNRLDPNRTYTRQELLDEHISNCTRLDYLYKRLVPDPATRRGLACGIFPAKYPGIAQPIDTPFLVVTSEYLAKPGVNSAPLEDTFVYFSACSTAASFETNGFDLFMGDGGVVMGFTGLVGHAYAKSTALRFYENLLKLVYDTDYQFDLEAFDSETDPGNPGTSPRLFTKGDATLRLKETVHLNPGGRGRLEGDSNAVVSVTPATRDGETYDLIDLDVEIDGAIIDTGRALSDYQVGIFLADANGEPTGSVLEPGWKTPESDGAMQIDDVKGTWAIPFQEVRFPKDLSTPQRVPLALQMKHPEGGISQTSYTLSTRDPNCPTATLAVNGAPKELVANEVTVTGFGPVWNISIGRAEFDEDGVQTDRIHPSAIITLSDVDLSALGTDWTTLDLSQTDGRSAVANYGDDAYYLSGEIELEDGSTFQTDATLRVRRLPNTRRLLGEVRGRAFAVTGQGRTISPDVGVDIDFVSADVNDAEPKTQCYFTR
jgi:hypothetical protein